jgi:2,4-dienoyl-CoA reductase-like NADH-dependent reductase (Old Yellow Enzyme family)
MAIYLDLFFQDDSNKRTDPFGGSIENRSRFLLEVVEVVRYVWGSDRIAVRIAPAGAWNLRVHAVFKASSLKLLLSPSGIVGPIEAQLTHLP